MTLDTRVYVRGPVDHKALFVKCNQLIGAHEGVKFSDKDGCISNAPAQGLDAWLIINYGSPLRDGTCPRMPHEPDDDDDCWQNHKPACYADVSFDTAYSYSGPDGGCGDLHARIIAELGHWLDTRGLAWSWKNEFTGEVHERYAGLTELGTGGAEASDWYRNFAAPAIARHVATGQTS
jgi:hypothetical protein